jgi:hypothetical protein
MTTDQLILNVERQQKIATALSRLWESLIPDHQPTPENFSGWVDCFGADAAVIAIRRTAAKARTCRRANLPMSGSDLERYCTGTMKHLGRSALEYRVQI